MKKAQQSDDKDARIEKLEREVRDLRFDWDQQYDKFRTLFARWAKRVEREEAHEPPISPAEAITPAEPHRVTNPLAARLLARNGGR